MIVAGLEKSSFVDFPGRISAVLFAPGCNFDCFYCHNRALLRQGVSLLSSGEVMSFLRKRAGLLEGVVLTGGEPTLQAGLAEFIRPLREMGYRIKLDTNGSRPDNVGALLGEGLLDYVAMDYKAPFGRYPEICGPGADPGPVKETLALLRTGNVSYELRTTFIPQLSPAEIGVMAQNAAPLPRYAIQAYRMPALFKDEDRFRVRCAPHPPTELREAARLAAPYASEVIVRE